MLRETNDLIGLQVDATDGSIGKIKDVYTDRDQWRVRYFRVDTGSWLTDRDVLLSPASIRLLDWSSRKVLVTLTRIQVQNAPPVGASARISRELEMALNRHYDWPNYWVGHGPKATISGVAAPPASGAERRPRAGPRHAERTSAAMPGGEPYVGGATEMIGFHLQARDGEIGPIEGFIIDDNDWSCRYAVVDTSNPSGGKRVIVSPEWFETVDWNRSRITIDVGRDQVLHAPACDGRLTREYETRLYHHYARPVYWRRAA